LSTVATYFQLLGKKKKKINQTASHLSGASVSKTEYWVDAPYQTSAKIFASFLEVPTYD